MPSGGETSESGTGAAATDPDVVLVIDRATGKVVGTAHYNPDTGVLEMDTPEETMVVEESSGYPAPSSSARTPTWPTGRRSAAYR